MAQQFEVQALGLNGIPYRIEIYNSNYSGTTVTQLNGDQQFIRFEGGQRERVGIEPIWGKEVRINVRTNEDLSPIFGLEDRDAEVRVFRTDTSSLVWKGFILTDFFQDEPLTDLPGVELRAVDGLTTLEGDSFDALSGVSDSDIDNDGSLISYTDLFTGVLSTLYDSPLDVEFAVEWYPDAGGQLTSSDNPLRFSGARPDVYYDSEDGEWFNQQSALEDALKSQGLEVRQSVIGGELTWLVAQPTALSSGSVKTWRYAPDGTEDASSPFTRDLSLDLSTADTNRPTREFERRSESISVIHNHKPIDNLVSNGGFESVGDWQITGSGSNPSYYAEREKYSNLGSQFPPQTQNNKYAVVFEYDSQGTDFPLSQDLGEVIGLPQGSAFTLEQTFLQDLSIFGGLDEFSVRLNVGQYWLKEETRKIQKDADPGTGSVFIGEISSRIPSGSIIPVTDDPANLSNGDDHSAKATIRLTEPAIPGDGELTGEISSGLKSGQIIRYPAWTTTQSRLPIAYWKISQGVFAPISVRAPTVLADGTNISGQSKIEYGAKHSGTNNLPLVHAVLDDVELSVTRQGSKIQQSIREASVSATGQSRDIQVLLSSGPTLENESRVKGLAPGGSSYQATDWGIGAGGGSLSLAGLQARERLRYLREHLERQQLTVYARDKSPVVTGEEIVQFDGKTWRIAEFSSDPASGEIGLTLIQHADAGTTDLSIATVRDTEDGGTSGGGSGTAPAVGGGGGVSDWDDLTGELSGPVPFDATDDDGNPTSRSLRFLNVTPQVDVTSDPANGIALEIKDQTNGNRLGTLTTDGRWETRGDMEAFADGSFGSGSSTNSLLQVEDAGTALTTDAASIDFTGSGVNVSVNGDDVTVDVSGGSGSDIDIEDNQTVVVGGATGLSFEGSGIDSVDNDGDGTATVNISKGSSTEVQEGGTAQVSDVTTLDFVGGDFSVANPTSGEAEVSLQNDSVTVAGNSVSLGGSTGIAHGDLSSIGSSDHHPKTTSASDLTDVSADSVTDAHHPEYTDEKAQDAVNALLSSGSGISLNYDDINNDLTITSTVTNTDTQTDLENSAGVVVTDADAMSFEAGANSTVSVSSDNDGTGTVLISSTDTQLSNSEVQTAINNDSDHGSTASHNYTTSASGLTDVSPDSDPDAHHAVFEPADYTPVTTVEAHGNALAIDISGDADTLDNVEGSNYARTDVSETFNFNVGFGGQTSPSYAIEATGDMRATGEVEAFLGSDRRLKIDIDPLDSALDKVGALTGYGFDWRGGDAVQPHKRGEKDVGLIAQEVEDVLPEAVKTFTDGHSEGYKSVSYDKLVPLLVEAIKDLRSQVNNLQ